MSDTKRLKRTVEEINKRLKSKNLQQKHLAEASGISQSAVSQMLSFKTELSKKRILEFATVVGGEPSFWENLIEEDMAEKAKEFSGGLCTVFRNENGQRIPVRYVDYRDDSKAAAKHMVDVITELLDRGFTPEDF